MRETPTALALYLIVYGLGSLYYSINMLARGLADSAPMETQRIMELVSMAGLGISGSLAIGVGLLLGRLLRRGSVLPKAVTYTSLVFSLLTFFMPGLALSCYMAYQLQQLPSSVPPETVEENSAPEESA